MGAGALRAPQGVTRARFRGGLGGWWQSHGEAMFPQLAPARRSGRRVSHSIIERLYQTANPLVMVQAQDILGLGSGARMNTPGTVGGRNWRWTLDSPLDARSAEELRVLSEQSRRRAPRRAVAAAA